MLDQTLLPTELVYLDLGTVAEVWEGIKRLRVRGAPAIGIAAAYGVCLACREVADKTFDEVWEACRQAAAYLATSRPTAVNLFWALDRMNDTMDSLPARWAAASSTAGSPAAWVQQALLATAEAIHAEDRRMCHAIGRFGAELLADGDQVLTHCNAGGLATAEYGTALSVFFTAQDQGKKLHVYVDETRPLLQGSRLTAWELMQRKVDCTLICDNMAAHVMATRSIQAVVVGADRIAANGDTANKIGTYNLAVLANFHRVPFYVAAPSSTFDLSIASGREIPIEERHPEEITHSFGWQSAPAGVPVYNPAFDVTPADLIAGIITERGLIRPVNRAQIEAVLQVV
jgi:methylthioribose-1-phosphate isomerase